MISLPPAFVRRVTGLLKDEAGAFFEALGQPAPVSARLNPRKPVPREALPFLDPPDGRVPWCEQGFYARERPVFTLDPALHAGGYYVQEASSMFVGQALRRFLDGRPARVLDLCAAPGGKSTLGLGLLPGGSLWVANEVIRPRAAVLKENLVKWGSDRAVVTCGDPARLASLAGAFDVVLVDAPCSGEGMFRKDARAAREWGEALARACEERQKRLLPAAWECLAPGGYLVYSTCTYNPGENERVLEWAARQFHADPAGIPHDFAGITPGDSPLPCYRFYPHKTRGEGFFIGALRKRDGLPFSLPAREARVPRVALPPAARALVGEAGGYTPYLAGETLGIIPSPHAAFVQHLGSRVGLLYRGVEIGETAGGKFRPSHALALWDALPREGTRAREVDLPTALRYLRKEEIRFDAPPGEWVLVTYRSLALGWVKAVGNRLNNYYPKEWRVRMDDAPRVV
ncbi:MAG: RNA methyltransferase [Odoribacteraceae bacterium]|jgi:16S rRNA C967 or C1407 C5-methylase (RsmB/RsmF family)/NOL1/NOP2/fmu family ribosome biogenesis protein|nr:RNA methyltransferase [Odoribacteraceae bacterium]